MSFNFRPNLFIMCDLFQANPWKPLLCTNCHQNRSGHTNISNCEHATNELPSSTSSMHLYEEIMAQYFTTNVEPLPTILTEDEDDDVSFSDEEEQQQQPQQIEIEKTNSIEFIQNQSMINTQGIVLMGPDLPIKEDSGKKIRKINLLRKTKSNASECLKKTEINESNLSKLRWFKTKKNNELPNEVIEKPNSSPIIQKVRVLPEISKLTLNEALNIARRQHSSSRSEVKPLTSIVNSHYGSSITSSTSSSTQSSGEYEPNPVQEESTYLTAISPVEKELPSMNLYDQTIKLLIENLTSDLRIIIDEYKQNLPVARFQTFKSFLNQDQSIEHLSTESSYFILLQILDESSRQSISIQTFDHFLITNHSIIPILVPTTTTTIVSNRNSDESMDDYLKVLARKFFHPTALPNFTNISTFENLSFRFLFAQLFSYSSNDFEQNQTFQRVRLLNLFSNKIQSIRQLQINDDNQRLIFTIYYLMHFLSQSDH